MRSKAHIIITIVVVIASLASYIFLNHAESSRAPKEDVEQYNNEDFESSDPQMVLPDVEMIKKVLETGRRLLPAS